uniref:Uncharacterized protein n=1 Tax=Corethron hystrix TaxID=216773 RepID=A0A7S1FYQ5_9STRA
MATTNISALCVRSSMTDPSNDVPDMGYIMVNKTSPVCDPSPAPSLSPSSSPAAAPMRINVPDPGTVPTIAPTSTAAPSSAPTCNDADEYCEVIIVGGKALSLCEYLKDLKITDNRRYKRRCNGRQYKILVRYVTDACPYLEDTPYETAKASHCDSDGNYIGDLDDLGRPVILIDYSEICPATCEVC